MRRPRDKQLEARLRAFGDAVHAQRQVLGWSQEQLADKAGLHRTYIGSVERGERNLALGNVYALADALNLPVTDLIE